MTNRSFVVIGTGLIGTSVALALRAKGATVWLRDADPAAARLAASLGAGDVLPGAGPPGPSGQAADVAVLAVPPAAVAKTLADAQAGRLARVYTDVASVKELPVAQAIALGADMASYVPGHPLAGRERHGPAAARADLFLGRTWALCPSDATSRAALGAVTAMVRECGADPVTVDPGTHDRWVALVSHAPHVVAAAMAARLEQAAPDALALAGQGLRDTTRIAAGDSLLWAQILAANAVPVAEVLAAVSGDLAEAARALGPAATTTMSDISEKAISDLLDRGRAGVARIPGKHGQAPRPFAVVQVVIRDQPGELAALFNAAGEAGVNIEDIRIEHSPGLPVGVAELSVRPPQVPALMRAMESGGWQARG